jgi:hypothetical protein
MNPHTSRREFIKSTSMLPVCAVAGATLMSATRVHHGEQVHKAASHRDVGDIGGPHLIRPIDQKATK